MVRLAEASTAPEHEYRACNRKLPVPVWDLFCDGRELPAVVTVVKRKIRTIANASQRIRIESMR
jgi:hypothetical protein